MPNYGWQLREVRAGGDGIVLLRFPPPTRSELRRSPDDFATFLVERYLQQATRRGESLPERLIATVWDADDPSATTTGEAEWP
ncbi:hypothetical protein ACIGXM_20480 [Kitasatospora sp. NPDC052896]|uniref:hypothetical protein n=1 Tax=Kitasatospora sp. NPDC052896 TaxID=3364061 RepID=UPI0037C4FAB6